MASLMALLPLLQVQVQLSALPPGLSPPPPPPPVRSDRSLQRVALAETTSQGTAITINGLGQKALWQLEGGELWLPLEVLQGQLGVSSSSGATGDLVLEWFGQRLAVPASRQRNLADEVAVPASALLQAAGVAIEPRGRELRLTLPPVPLSQLRSRDQGNGARRIVFDLPGPALARSGDGSLQLGIQASSSQLEQLQALGLEARASGGWIQLRPSGGGEPRLLSLGTPWRLVLDLPPDARAARPDAPRPGGDPRLLALQRQGVQIERRVVRLGGRELLLSSVRLDPRSAPLDLRPLTRSDGMQGLSSLSQLARGEQALIAINGGFFNRVNRLPLGALRSEGRWLSGPILNRGAVGWGQASLPSFGRLSLDESVLDPSGQRWPIATVNSGYVQKGLSRYTAEWGRSYQPISGTEMAVLVRNGSVVQRFEPGQLSQLGSVPLGAGDLLLVARGGVNVPWQPGDRLLLTSRPTSPVGQLPYVVGGGPLLLQDGQVVLNGGAEGFGSGFLSQGAPRTVIGSDGRLLWLVTLQGVNDAGPTLLQSALALQQLGLRDALNLDGGSSTGLVLGDNHAVKGRGVAAAVHNGLGLVPRLATLSSGQGAPTASERLAVSP
jgi:hypothetical protein